MSVLIAVPADGGTIVVEAPDELSPAGVVRAAKPGEVVHQAGETLEQALETSLIPVARAVTKSLASVSPDAVEVSLGLKLSAEAGVIISKVAGEASFEVKLSWTRDAGDGS
jgi:Trypsin-co-occurring domain 1